MGQQLAPTKRITRQTLIAQEQRLVAELLRLHREGSSLTLIGDKLHQLRTVRAQLHPTGGMKLRRTPISNWGTIAYYTPSGWRTM